mmetsp:Transcript_143987/g.460833  ORF Transcript_143987/g.460833 Transcript_143987/m.460833 type:complete len:193 (+) Transcript_143987:125-703(+)
MEFGQMRTSWSGAPEDFPGQTVIFIQSPESFPMYEKRWDPRQVFPSLLEGVVEEREWTEFCQLVDLLVGRFWSDSFWTLMGIPIEVGSFALMWFSGVGTNDCWEICIVLLFVWMGLVWSLKWLNGGIDASIEDLAIEFAEKFPPDLADFKYDYAWTEMMRPMAAREWRAIVISRKDECSTRLQAQLYGYGLE